MFKNYSIPGQVILEYISRAQRELIPYLRNQLKIEKELGDIVEYKSKEHLAYAIDTYSNQILFETLKEKKIEGDVFSEEGGWLKLGEKHNHYIICDPYCNTSLTMRGFRESAIAICITDQYGEFEACAIGDLQIDRIFFADNTGAYLLNFETSNKWTSSPLRVSEIENLEKAFVVASLLKQKRRMKSKNSTFFANAKILHNVDGAIMIGRLAAGHIDAYLDPFIGQPLYEIPCCQLILQAGGIVTDTNGAPFNLAEIIRSLEENPKDRYQFVATGTQKLHDEILKGLI